MSIELTNLEASRMYELLSESEKLRARIAELERVLWLAKRAVYEGVGTHLEFCEQGEKCEWLMTMREAIAEIKSVLGEIALVNPQQPREEK